MRLMRNIIIGLVLVITGIALLMFIPSPQPPASKPWEINMMPDGNIEVLGIHLGNTRYQSAQESLGVFGKTALFVDPDGSLSIEAFFDSINLAGLSAKLVLNLSVPPDELEQMLARAKAGKLQPSGAHQHELAEQDRQRLLKAPVIGMTYIPSVRLDADMLKTRFGEPERIQQLHNSEDGTTTQHWVYPSKYLTIDLPQEQKPLLVYRAKNEFLEQE